MFNMVVNIFVFSELFSFQFPISLEEQSHDITVQSSKTKVSNTHITFEKH